MSTSDVYANGHESKNSCVHYRHHRSAEAMEGLAGIAVTSSRVSIVIVDSLFIHTLTFAQFQSDIRETRTLYGLGSIPTATSWQGSQLIQTSLNDCSTAVKKP